MSNAAATDHLIDAKEVARRLGMSAKWVYATASAGKLPFVQVGGRKRFDPADVEAYIAANRGAQ